MKVELVPLLDDNYGYFLIDEKTGDCIVVDPAEADKVMAAFTTLQSKYTAENGKSLNFKTILTTHRHWDHAGGNNAMIALMKERSDSDNDTIRCYGGKLDNVEGCTNSVEHEDEFVIGNLKIQCIHTPGHTNGHICYFVQDLNEEQEQQETTRGLFCGDCLFVGGAGKFFEGTPADMYLSFERLGTLPLDTKIFCGHEYTISNYRFATWLDETNTLLQDQNNLAKLQRENNQPTIPTTLQIELDTNPFFRTTQLRERVLNILEEKDDKTILEKQDEKHERDINIWTMGQIRELKNNFK